MERSKTEQPSNTSIQQNEQKEPPSINNSLPHKKASSYLTIPSSNPISVGGTGSYQDYYYQHPSPSSHIFGRNESLMRVLEAEDDTVIRGRRMRMHSVSTDTTHMIVTSSSTPLLLPLTNKTAPVLEENNFVEYNFEYLQEKKRTIGEKLDTILHICRRPFFYLCSCAGLITNLPLFDGPQIGRAHV